MMEYFASVCFVGLCLLATSGVNATIPVEISSVKVLGNQSDTHLTGWVLQRDGGAVGSLGGKIVWFFSDTSYTHNGVDSLPFYDNTVAVGHPDKPLTLATPQKYGIPYTSIEDKFNTDNKFSPRVVLWPMSGVVEVSSGHGYIWVPKGYYGSTKKTNSNGQKYYVPTPNKGIVLCAVTIGSDGYPTVSRVSDEPFFPASGPGYGSLASAKDSKFVYLYSSNNEGDDNYNVFVARAPLSQASNLSAFEYYFKSDNTWHNKAPSIKDTNNAIFTQYLGLNGNIYYSTYHGLWLMFYSTGGDHAVYYASAASAHGPWEAGKKFYTAPIPPKPATYIYGTTGNNLYDSTGHSAYIQFTWPHPGGYANWVIQANFVENASNSQSQKTQKITL